MFGLETVTTAVVGTIAWITFGEGFGDLASLNHLPSGWALFPFISGISMCPPQINDRMLMPTHPSSQSTQSRLLFKTSFRGESIDLPTGYGCLLSYLLYVGLFFQLPELIVTLFLSFPLWDAPFPSFLALECVTTFCIGLTGLTRKFKVIKLGLHYDSPQAVGKYLDVGPALNGQYFIYAHILH